MNHACCTLLVGLLACRQAQPQPPPPPVDSAPVDSGRDSAADSGLGSSPADSGASDSGFGSDSGQPAKGSITLALLPDTQIYVGSDATAAYFDAQTRWIVEHSHEIDFVSQLGDIVQNGAEDDTSPGNQDEWGRAAAAMAILDDGAVPWATAVGNHELETVDVLSSGYATWRSIFGPLTTGRFDGKAWFGGASASELNSWQTLQSGGLSLLLLHLELDIPDTAIAWAEQIMAAHPGWPTVVATHSHLGSVSTPYLSGDGRNDAEAVREKLLRPNAQIFLMLNGHHGTEQHGTVLNEACHPVLEMALDYSSRDNGGDSWLGLVTIDPEQGTITRSTYAPAHDRWETDSNSAFTVTWDWAERFSGEAAPSQASDEAVEIVDDFSTDSASDYRLSDSYGSGGDFVIRDGEMILQPAANNTVAAVYIPRQMVAGERWGITVPEQANVMFMASTDPIQPTGTEGLGFRFRRDTSGLRIGTYAPDESLGDYTADPGGEITLWIHRVDATHFEFTVESLPCGVRTVVDSLELAALAEVESMYVGLQAWSPSPADIRLDDLRIALPQK